MEGLCELGAVCVHWSPPRLPVPVRSVVRRDGFHAAVIDSKERFFRERKAKLLWRCPSRALRGLEQLVEDLHFLSEQPSTAHTDICARPARPVVGAAHRRGQKVLSDYPNNCDSDDSRVDLPSSARYALASSSAPAAVSILSLLLKRVLPAIPGTSDEIGHWVGGAAPPESCLGVGIGWRFEPTNDVVFPGR